MQQLGVESRRCINDDHIIRRALADQLHAFDLTDPTCSGPLGIAVDQAGVASRFLKSDTKQDGERALTRAALAIAQSDLHDIGSS